PKTAVLLRAIAEPDAPPRGGLDPCEAANQASTPSCYRLSRPDRSRSQGQLAVPDTLSLGVLGQTLVQVGDSLTDQQVLVQAGIDPVDMVRIGRIEPLQTTNRLGDLIYARR